MKHSILFTIVLGFLLSLPCLAVAQSSAPLDGEWELLPASSADMDHFRFFGLTVKTS